VSFSEPARVPATTFRAVREGDRFVSFRPGRTVAASISRALVEGALQPCRAGSAEAREVAISTFAEGRFGCPPTVAFRGAAGGPRGLPIGPRWSCRGAGQGPVREWSPEPADRPPAEPADDPAKGPFASLREVPAEPADRSRRSPARAPREWSLRGPAEGPYGASDRSTAGVVSPPPRGRHGRADRSLVDPLRGPVRGVRSVPGGNVRGPAEGVLKCVP
jgi:hypothetical protein